MRTFLHARAARNVAAHDAALEEGPPRGWVAEGMYDWETLHAQPYYREQLRALDAGEPVTVARWELPLPLAVPAIANAYVVHPGGRITVAEYERCR